MRCAGGEGASSSPSSILSSSVTADREMPSPVLPGACPDVEANVGLST